MPRSAARAVALASLLAVSALTAPRPAAAVGVGGPGIYSCIDANGKKLTSDRPIRECTARDQRVLNADGSVKRVLPPTLSAEEQAEREAAERRAAAERSAQQDAIRRDRNLRLRFPNEAAHDKARAAALDDVRKSIAQSQLRLAKLDAERKPLLDEAEFYQGKPMPRRLRGQLDAVDAGTEAQRTLIQNQQAELVRINTLYDVELERLRKLWGGAVAGSTGAAAPRDAKP